MSHTVHPDSHVAGLADGCPRCAEHAKDPLVTLDDLNIRDLVTRAVDETPARSETEALAIREVERVLFRAAKLTLAAPEILDRYLLESWRVPAHFNERTTSGTH